MTTHHMKLEPAPFEKIKAGTKTIEIRLYDEKRRLLTVGDTIVFACTTDPEQTITTHVTQLHAFPTFKELFAAYPAHMYGSAHQDEWEHMYTYYAPEEEKKYGVIAIGLALTMEHKMAKSYGVLPVFKSVAGHNVLIIQHTHGGHWGFPKGTPEGSETPVQTAVRELCEETGITEKHIRIQENPVFHESYTFERDGVAYDKTNTYYVGFVDVMSSGGYLDDVSAIAWVSLQEAKERLTHKEAVMVVEELEQYLNL